MCTLTFPFFQIIRSVLLIVAVLCFGGASVCAKPLQSTVTSTGDWKPYVESRTSADGRSGELWVNGQIVLRLRTAQGITSPIERARIAADRLQTVIAQGLKPADVVMDAQTDKINPRLKAAGQVIATSSMDEAKGTAASPVGLAYQWAAQLKAALQIPALTATVQAQPFLVPLGENRTVSIGGAARGTITVLTGSGDSKTVTASADSPNGIVLVTGNSKGRDTLTITREGVSVQIVVQALPYAGSFDAPRPVTVTGTLSTAEVIARHVAASALSSAKGLPGSVVRLQTDTLNVAALQSGQRQTVDVPLQITGNEMLTVEKTVRVPVINTSLAPQKTSALFYSNDPEQISGFGTLFVGRMDDDQTTRLLYHHQSSMSRAAWFTVELINDGETRSVVQVVGARRDPCATRFGSGIAPPLCSFGIRKATRARWWRFPRIPASA